MVKFWPFRNLVLKSQGLEQSRHWARPQLLAPTNPNSPPSTTRPEHLTVIRLPVPTKIRVVSVCVWIVGARAGSTFFVLFLLTGTDPLGVLPTVKVLVGKWEPWGGDDVQIARWL